MKNSIELSIIIPVLNEKDVLPELISIIKELFNKLGNQSNEIIFIDDGSQDETLAIIEQTARSDPRFKALSLSRNFGHQAAISAGLDYASGDAVVIMDGDLQDSPEAILDFINLYKQGYDVVYARRVHRKENLLMRACYYLFYRLMAMLSDIQIPVDAGDFGLMSRQVADVVRSFPERTRYLRGLRTWAGFKQTGVDVERGPRFAGEAKYSTLKLFKLAFDGIFSFSSVPLRAASIFGGTAVLVSGLFSIYALYIKLVYNTSPQGFTSLILTLVFLSGIQMFFLGVIGEYIARIYHESKNRPLYVVRSKIGISDG